MLDRLEYLVAYVGSAALVALAAVVLSSPRISTFSCQPSGANDSQACELTATWAAVEHEASLTRLDGLALDASRDAHALAANEAAAVVAASGQD